MMSFTKRALLAGTPKPAQNEGRWLYAIELYHNDGPWQNPSDYKKLNGVLRYSRGTNADGFTLSGMAYNGKWNATDQIPQRAVDRGVISRFGTLDPTDGGQSERSSFSMRWARKDSEQATRLSAYAIHSRLDLFNNFTYALDDPANGDQFHQLDRRTIAGGKASQTYYGTIFGVKSEIEFGAQVRNDDIRVGLLKTNQRDYLSTVREDKVSELSLAGYGQSTLRWTPWFRTITGLRYDYLQGQVASNLAANSGRASDTIASPKLGLVFGPWAGTEFYLSGGFGHHSNDVRGALTTVDPADGATPQVRSPLLVRSKGAEVGVRYEALPGFTSSAAAFVLDYDSEIVFAGDAGTTVASRPSRRVGVEYSLLWKIMPSLTLDLDYAYSQARFTSDDPANAGRRIPGAVEGVAKVALNFDNVMGGWFGGVNFRYFGPRPLISDNSVRSKPSMPLSAKLGYKFSDSLIARFDVFNVLNQKASQVDYFYASQLRGETSGVNDVHFHPLEPTSFRLTVTKLF